VNGEHEMVIPRLRCLRWLAEHGLLEHAIAGPSSGPLVNDDDVLDSWLVSLEPGELEHVLGCL
jgi:hypothetical protein